MADNGINMPSGFGGLVKFKEEYESKFNLKPIHVVIFIILIVVFRIALPFIIK
jgi:preprotein translocase subunit Sec61beta